MIFIPKYGIDGAAMATALSLLIFNICKMVFVYVKLNMQPFTSKTFFTVLIFFIIYTVVQYLPIINNAFLDITIRSLLISILFIPLLIKFKLSDDINKVIFSVISYLYKK